MARASAIPLCSALLVLTGCLLPKALPPTPADRAAIVTIEDFADWLEAASVALTPEAQTLTKRKIASSYELTYDYRGSSSADGVEPIQVVVHAELSVHPNGVSALHNFNGYGVGLRAGLRRGGASLERVEPALEWGEDFDFYTIQRGEQQIGNGFIGRVGRIASYVLISGLYSSDTALFELALSPKLRALEGYDPTPADGALAAID